MNKKVAGDRMRILIASTTYAPALNGQAVFSTNLAEGLAGKGHQVQVIVPAVDRPPVQIQNRVQIQANPLLDFRFIHPDMAFSWAFPGQARAILEAFQPDVVHLQDPSPLSQSLLRAARHLNIPVIATHHPGPAVWAPYFRGEGWWVRNLVAPLVWNFFVSYLNRVDEVVTPSRASARMLQLHHLRTRVQAISCGVPPNALRKVDGCRQSRGGDAPLFVYVGRLDDEKDVDVLIRAFGRMHSQQARLLLAGSGSSEKELRRLAERLKLTDRLEFLGKVQRVELPCLLDRADIFVMPGASESLSIATLEAMAACKPVIAARSMALPELVPDGENGLLFTPGDASDLATKLDEIIAQRAGWHRMGESSRVIASTHAFSNTLRFYEAAYQNLVEHQQAVPRRVIPRWSIARWAQNPAWMMSVVQWAALVVILVISLITRNHVVIAAPPENIDLLTPEVLEELQQVINMLKNLEINSRPAGSLLPAIIKLLII